MTVDFPELDLHVPSSPRITEDDYFHIKRLSREIADVDVCSHDDIARELTVTSSAEDALPSRCDVINSQWMFFRTEPSNDYKKTRGIGNGDHLSSVCEAQSCVWFDVINSTVERGITLDLLVDYKIKAVVTVEDVKMAAERDGGGITAMANGQQVALFYHNHTVYCVDEICPHAGGPLHTGDIEDLGVEVGVVCPWHKFCFSLNTGRPLRPLGRPEHLCIYPVQQTSDKYITVGFKRFHPSHFCNEDF